MFTGIVQHEGVVTTARQSRGLLQLEVRSELARELKRGDSIAVNGVCLTATRVGRRSFTAEVMDETLHRSTLGGLRRKARVNLELPARLSDRLGGHLVQGHVDGKARVARVERDDGNLRVWLEAGRDVIRYLVAKGSVTLDGVSLTVVEVGAATFQVALIPHTASETTLGDLGPGVEVNVEVDVIAKYVERLVAPIERAVHATGTR